MDLNAFEVNREILMVFYRLIWYLHIYTHIEIHTYIYIEIYINLLRGLIWIESP